MLFNSCLCYKIFNYDGHNGYDGLALLSHIHFRSSCILTHSIINHAGSRCNKKAQCDHSCGCLKYDGKQSKPGDKPIGIGQTSYEIPSQYMIPLYFFFGVLFFKTASLDLFFFFGCLVVRSLEF